MGKLRVVRKILKIERELAKNPELEKRLTEWLKEHKGLDLDNMDVTPEDAEALIEAYEKIKHE